MHEWGPITGEEHHQVDDWPETVGEIMSTDLFTVRPDDPISLAASFMDWRHTRHLPVEQDGKLIRLLSSREALHHVPSCRDRDESKRVTVADIMYTQPLIVNRETTVETALKLMLDNQLDCLLIMVDNELTGIVTSKDPLQVLLAHVTKTTRSMCSV